MKQKKIGVLALQGAFALHRPHIEAAGAEYIEVTHSDDLREIDALILPGGESSTLLKLIQTYQLEEPIRDFARTKPIWGICAGAILLAQKVKSPSQPSFALVDIEIERNGYGRQLQSEESEINGCFVSYVRAPIISSTGERVEVLHRRNSKATWAKDGHHLVTTFHPELGRTYPSKFHRDFVQTLEATQPA